MSYSVTHSLSRDEALELTSRVARHFEVAWIKPAIGAMGVVCGIVAIFVLMQLLHRMTGAYQSSFLALVLLLAPVAGVFAFQSLGEWMDRRFGNKISPPDRWSSGWEISVDDEAITVSNDWSHSRHSWDGVTAAYKLPEAYMLIVAATPLYLPRPLFDSVNDADAFVDDLKRWLPDDAVVSLD